MNQTGLHFGLARLRLLFPWFSRRRYFVERASTRSAAQKLTPIAKVLADAGRDSTTPAD